MPDLEKILVYRGEFAAIQNFSKESITLKPSGSASFILILVSISIILCFCWHKGNTAHTRKILISIKKENQFLRLLLYLEIQA